MIAPGRGEVWLTDLSPVRGHEQAGRRPTLIVSENVFVERRLAAEVGDTLGGKSHAVVTWPDWTWRGGGVCTITIDHASGVLAAGADPRRMGYAIGW